MKSTILLFILFSILAGCATQKSVPPDDLRANLESAQIKAYSIVEESHNVSPPESGTAIETNAKGIIADTQSAMGGVNTLAHENSKLKAENKALKGISTTDWVIAAGITLLLIYLAAKIANVFWYVVPLPACGLILSQIVSWVLEHLAFLLLGFGVIAAAGAAVFVYSAFKGNVKAIEKIKKVLPEDIRDKIFGPVGEDGLMGKEQPKHTQNLVKKIKD